MKAIILSAGEGTRLRPLTNDVPKCMVKLFGKSLLEWQLNVFHKCDVNDISVVTGYKSEKISYSNVKYFHNPNYAITNMVETLFCARDILNDDVIVSYGDIIFEQNVLERLLNSKHDISIVVDQNWKKYWQKRFHNILDDVESLRLKNNIICDLGNKVQNLDEVQGQYIGLMKFSRKIIGELIHFYDTAKNKSAEGKNPLNSNIPFEKSYMTDFIRGLIHKGYEVNAIFIQNGWLELDSINDYNVYSEMYKTKILDEFFHIE